MKINLKEIIDKKYSEYMEKTDSWTEDLPSGKVGVCDLCTNKDNLTEHHPIPKRVFPRANPSLMTFLEKMTINVCNKCHNKLHPENIWKENIIKFEDIVKKEASNVENKAKKEIELSKKEISNAKQEVNNIGSKYEQQGKELKGKISQITELKEKVKTLTKDLNSEKGKSESKSLIDRGLENDAMVFFNFADFLVDGEKYEEHLKEHLTKEVEKERDSIMNKRNVQQRDINLLIKKMEMKSQSLNFKKYTQEHIDSALRMLGNITKKIEDEVFEECFSTDGMKK